MSKKIGVIIGSLRKNSFSESVAKYLISTKPDGFEFEVIDISKLPIYNQDYDEGDTPAEYTTFREKIKSMDAYLFVTPEHNRSFPAALKNALDVGSRPFGQNVWGGKPGAIVSASPGNIGGFGANHHLRQVLSFLDVQTMAQPEVYLSGVHTLLDDKGEFNNDGTKGFLSQVMDSFVAWINKLS